MELTQEEWISIKNMFYDGIMCKDTHEISIDAWDFIEKEAIRKGYVKIENQDLKIGDKVSILCSDSEGTIRSDLNVHNQYKVEIHHNSGFYMFYERSGLRLKESVQEEPLIVHNVMLYRGKNYLAQPISQPISKNRCEKCALCENDIVDNLKINCHEYFKCLPSCYWKSFDDITIDDNLACMRKDIGSIGLVDRYSNFMRLYGVSKDKYILHPELGKIAIEYQGIRLATAKELQELEECFNHEHK